MPINPLANKGFAIRLGITLLLISTAATTGYVGGSLLIQHMRKQHMPCLPYQAFHPLQQQLTGIEETCTFLWGKPAAEGINLQAIYSAQEGLLLAVQDHIQALQADHRLCQDQLKALRRGVLQARNALRTTQSIIHKDAPASLHSRRQPCSAHGQAATYWDPRLVPEDW